MRKRVEIQEAEQEFSDRVWYNRKLVMLERIQNGLEPMPDEDLMDKVTAGMRAIEERYGGKDTLAYDDFEWGMVNGKLSALRWVMGDDWDMLDT